MKPKHLLILVVLALVLGGLAYWSSRDRDKSVSSLVGTKVLPGLSINDVNKIVITSAGSTVTVAKAKGIWTVPDRYNYPADFDKVAETMRDISELTVGQVLTISDDQLGSLNLLSPVLKEEISALADARRGQANETGRTGTLLELMDNRDNMLAYLLIGKSFMRQPAEKTAGPIMAFGGYADGQYVLRPDGKICLVSKTLDRLLENIKTWLDDTFINVRPSDIQEITVTGPDRDPIKLTGKSDGQGLSLEGISDTEECDTFKINQMADALQYLSFDDVASPALTPKETGLDNPVVFTARAKQGQVYTLQIGGVVTDAGSSDRYVHATIGYEPGVPETEPSSEQLSDTHDKTLQKEQIKENTRILNDKLSPWTYTVKSYRVNSMLLKREDLIKKKEEEPKADQPLA